MIHTHSLSLSLFLFLSLSPSTFVLQEIEEEPEWDFQVTAEQRQAITDLVASAKEEASQVFDPNVSSSPILPPSFFYPLR